MRSNEIAVHRLFNHGLVNPKFTDAADVVRWLGAAQAQDYGPSKWSLGMRMRSATDGGIEAAFARGEFVRTHILRPTWHFVPAKDLLWMLELSAPRVHAANGYMYRQVNLDKASLKRSMKVIRSALRGGRQLTRKELAAALAAAGIKGENLRITYIVMYAELEGLICSGARRGKQFTYALVDERAPIQNSLSLNQGLAELCRRYFRSHGPAALQDFVWWSGLTMVDARKGIEMVEGELIEMKIDSVSYWLPSSPSPEQLPSPFALLTPTYDEYTLSYKDRSALFGRIPQGEVIETDIFQFISIDGKIVGNWKRTIKKDSVDIEINHLTELRKTEKAAIQQEVSRYADFMGLPANLT
jgi:hypothetical protein